jgi:hypothetical protein
MAAHHHHPGPLLLNALTILDCDQKTGQRLDRQNDQQTKDCIGRESNPGLADIEINDPEWQRPILPLNHQCLLMSNPPITIIMLLDANAQGQTKTRFIESFSQTSRKGAISWSFG